MPRNMSIDEQLKGLSSHTPAMDASDNVAAVGSRHGSINEASPYPATITEGFLWLGDHKHASTDGVMRDLKITHVVDACLWSPSHRKPSVIVAGYGEALLIEPWREPTAATLSLASIAGVCEERPLSCSSIDMLRGIVAKRCRRFGPLQRLVRRTAALCNASAGGWPRT